LKVVFILCHVRNASIFNFLFIGKTVVLYRVGDHIDLSRGPMVGDTSFVGKCTVTAVSISF